MTMKYLSAFIVAVIAIGAIACKSSNALKQGNQTIRLSGNWTIDKVDYSGTAARLKVTSFDDVTASCFEGSTWNLVQNGNGSYTINSTQAGCTGGARTIFWSVQVENGNNYFQFKNIGANKAKTVTDGYRLEITASSATEFSLRSPVQFEGQTIYINYHFTKN